MNKEKSKEKESDIVTPGRHFFTPDRMEREMGRVFRDLWRGPRFRFGWPGVLRDRDFEFGIQMPVMDVYEEKDDVVVKAELPGTKKEDLEINLSGDLLVIKVEKKRETEVDEKDYYYSERSFGRYERSIEMPVKVLPDKVRAVFKDGVLEVRLQKSEEAKRKEIKIKIE